MSCARDISGEDNELQPPWREPARGLRISESLQRGLELLLVFSSQSPVLRLVDLASETGLTGPTARRYARTLVRMGFLQQDTDSKYLLAPRAADPGLSLIATMRRALPVLTVLEELRDGTGYTVSLGVMRHHSVTYVHRLFGHRQSQYEVDLELRAGAHIPLYCTALGKALLATLPDEWRRWLIRDIDFVPQGPRSIITHQELIRELRELDVSEPVISDEEFVVGARSIAMYVPMPNENRPTGIEVTVPSRHLTVAELQEQIGPAIVYAAYLISQVLDEPLAE